MAGQFRKQIKLAPGVRLTRPGTGMAWRMGQRNATVTIGKRCPVLTAGRPPAPPQQRKIAGVPGLSAEQSAQRAVTVQMLAEVNDFGEIYFVNRAGEQLPEAWVEKARLLRANDVRIQVQKKCDDINRNIEMLGELHLYTPPPDAGPKVESVPYKTPRPRIPVLKSKGFMGWLFKSVAQRIDAENADTTARYEAAKATWEADKSTHEAQQTESRLVIERANAGERGAMERLLEMKLAEVVWPCEILVSVEVADAFLLRMDIRVPDLDEMPLHFAMVPPKGNQLALSDITQSQVRWLYMRFVHSLAFRIIGETFAHLQSVSNILCACYYERKNEETGDKSTVHAMAMAIKRSEWRKVGFSNIRAVDVVAEFSKFELRRGMHKTGVFKPVEPFTEFPSDAPPPDAAAAAAEEDTGTE